MNSGDRDAWVADIEVLIAVVIVIMIVVMIVTGTSVVEYLWVFDPRTSLLYRQGDFI